MNTLLMAKCLGPEMKQTIKVSIPYLKLDTTFNMYFRENKQLLVHDYKEEARDGDWLLIQQLQQPLSLRVSHKLQRIIYKAGQVIDPFNGKQCLGYEYTSDADRQSLLFNLKPTLQRKPSER